MTGSASNGERSATSSTGTACRCAAAASRPDQVDDAIHLYNLGWSLARVGGHLGVNHATVLNKLRERGIHTRDTHGRWCVEADGVR
ncbi:hypothetical protein F9C11_11905 [Amycolatopsis sp. VS8301801F10]|uniref:hypothetical protein n=1 Tax=Amycolatopsis sp. VS8301801F10 TaxID=2652442 RepID=UPI0038FC91D5